MTGFVQSAIDRELPFLRAEAEARMTSIAIIRRKTGQMTTNARGLEVPEWTIVYSGPCRIRNDRGRYYTQNISGVDRTLGLNELCIPAASDKLAAGDLAEVTGDGADIWIVLNAARGSQETDYRVPVQVADRPEEWS